MIHRPNRPAGWIIAPLALGLALRLWFIEHAARIAGDTLVYGGIASNWMDHGVYGFVLTNGLPQPTLIRLPGYPLFLVACFKLFGTENYAAVMYLQAAIDLAACIFLANLAGRRLGAHAGRATLWLACLCPFTASYVAAPLTETLTLAMIVAAFYALHRWNEAGGDCNRWLFLLSATLAYAILLRPEQGLLAVAILPSVLWLSHTSGCPMLVKVLSLQGGVFARRAHRLAPAATAALLALLPLLPWTLRNARTFHVFQPLAPRYATDPGEPIPNGFQHWYRTWAIDFASTEDIYWNYDGAPIQLADLPNRAFDTQSEYSTTETLLNEYNETTTATPKLDARFNALAEARIAANPVRYYVALPLARLANMALRPRTEMLPTPLEWWKFSEHPGQTIFAAAYATLNLAYLALAAWGATLWLRSRNHLPLLAATLATIALRSALLLTLDNSEPRYTLEFFPILFLLAAVPFTSRSQVQVLSS